MTAQKLTGGQMIADYLIREGVEKVFAIPGHGNTALLDAFVDRKGEIEVIPAMHEQGAAHMADGYYRASGKVAVVCTSIGPGATNTLTGVVTAFADSQPFLLITGAVHTYMEYKGVLQELDRPHGNNFPAMVQPAVKRWWQPHRLDQIPLALGQAFNTMYEGRRGPVLLDIPQDLQAEAGDYTPSQAPAVPTPGRPATPRLFGPRPGCCPARLDRSSWPAGASSPPTPPPSFSRWPRSSGPRSPTRSWARGHFRPTTICTPGRAVTWARSPATP